MPHVPRCLAVLVFFDHDSVDLSGLSPTISTRRAAYR
jgi:hypothetical protein